MYVRERVGEQFAGRVTGVAPFGVFVTLNDLYVEGLVHVSELGGQPVGIETVGHGEPGRVVGDHQVLVPQGGRWSGCGSRP